jgi:peptide/nickel transport system substrate-binding protein
MKRLLSVFSLLFAALGGAANAQTTLVIAIAADPTGLDPEAVLNNTSGFVMGTIYDGLVKYKSGSVEVEPALAESWSISQDGLSYTFKLRKGVKFHDGTAFDAPGFVKTIKRLSKDDPDTIYATGTVETFNTYGDMASVESTDDATVVFKLKNPSGPFITDLAMVWNGVVSPTAYNKLKKETRSAPAPSSSRNGAAATRSCSTPTRPTGTASRRSTASSSR